MTLKNISLTLATAAMLLCANHALAYEHEADRPVQPAGKASAASNRVAAKHTISMIKPGPKVKLLDVNSANKSALKKLPEITDAEADKIIANRPYGSKAWLVTNKIVDAKTYGAIKALIEARQTLKNIKKMQTMSEKTGTK